MDTMYFFKNQFLNEQKFLVRISFYNNNVRKLCTLPLTWVSHANFDKFFDFVVNIKFIDTYKISIKKAETFSSKFFVACLQGQ